MKFTGLFLTIFTLVAPSICAAQPISEHRVSFAPGTSGTTIQGRIDGSQIADYILGARAGQVMTVDFSPTNPSAYFNVMRGADPAAIFIGSTSGNSFSGALPGDGDYRIRVYLMRSAARRNEVSDFTLTVGIGAAAPSPAASGDYADGLAGGPDWWAVAGVTAGDLLNVRSGPGAANPVVGQLGNGDRVRNLGCRMNGETKWCEIEMPGDQPVRGWAAGRYLTEAAGVSTPNREATGMIPCALAVGQPMATCTFRVSRGSGGTASVWVALPSGGERYLDFREGRLVGSDPGMQVFQDRMGDLNIVSINGIERYELPDAILFGG